MGGRLSNVAVALAAMGFFVSSMASAMAEGPTSFRLLRLEQDLAKWYPSTGTTDVVVRYAFATDQMYFPEARNCRKIQPAAAALKPSGLGMERFRQQTRDAMRLWEDIVDIKFVETDAVDEADLVIGAQVQPRGRAFTNVELEDKKAGAGEDEPRSIRRSLVCLNPEVRWKDGFDGDLEVYDLTYTMAHEVGHAIGLDHPSPQGQLMSFRYHERFATLQVGDIDGALKLYRPAPGAYLRRAVAQSAASSRQRVAGAKGREGESRFGLGSDRR